MLCFFFSRHLFHCFFFFLPGIFIWWIFFALAHDNILFIYLSSFFLCVCVACTYYTYKQHILLDDELRVQATSTVCKSILFTFTLMVFILTFNERTGVKAEKNFLTLFSFLVKYFGDGFFEVTSFFQCFFFFLFHFRFLLFSYFCALHNQGTDVFRIFFFFLNNACICICVIVYINKRRTV